MKNKHIRLEKPELIYAAALLDYQIRNKEFLTPFVAKRGENFYSVEFQEQSIEKNIHNWSINTGYCYYIFENKENKIIGTINLSNIIRGVFQSCFLGYSLDKDYINKGYMSFAVKKVVDFAFKELKLHRIEANVMPRNIASKKVLEKNNFYEEGLAKKYLLINGKWEDHIHMVILNKDYVVL